MFWLCGLLGYRFPGCFALFGVAMGVCVWGGGFLGLFGLVRLGTCWRCIVCVCVVIGLRF